MAGVVLLLMAMLITMSLLFTGAASATAYCPETNYNPGPGPLNLTQPQDGSDTRIQNQKGFVYHCLVNFTSFLWYRNVKGVRTLVQEERGRVRLLRHNQTIEIVRAKLADDGYYHFIASNGTHEVNGSFRLSIRCDPTIASFAIEEQPKQHVQLGSQRTLQCALNTERCGWRRKERYLYWIWGNSTADLPLKNGQFDSLSVVCDSLYIYGRNCSVHISRIEEQHYRSPFICVVVQGGRGFILNHRVTLLPPVTIVKSWLPRVIGVAVSAGLLMVVVVVACCLWHRYRYRMAFWLRRLPDRDKFQHDAVIVHGEDHEHFAREHLQPRLRQFGYDIMEEAAELGKPETLEKANAILNSYCVILTFSEEELRDRSTCFLTAIARLKARPSVLFIRYHNSDYNSATNARYHANKNVNNKLPGSKDTDEKFEKTLMNGSSEKEVTLNHVVTIAEVEDNSTAERKSLVKSKSDVWNNENVKGFKMVTWPSQPSNTKGKKNDHNVKMDSREVEKFWYQVRKNLPRPARMRSQRESGSEILSTTHQSSFTSS